MKEKNIADSRTLLLESANEFLKQMSNNLIQRPYPCVKNVALQSDSNDSYVRYTDDTVKRSDPKMRCAISIKDMITNVDSDGFVRDVDFVEVCHTIGHEARHAYQMLTLYQQPNLTGRDLDMARMAVLSVTFPSYYKSTYFYSPFELDAEKHGLLDAVEYLNKYLVDEHGEPLIDAKACLLHNAQERARDAGGAEFGTFDDIVQHFDSHMNDYQCYERRIDLSGESKDMSACLRSCPDWMAVINAPARQRIGVDFDKKLFPIALDLKPKGISMMACLDEEVKETRKTCPSHLNIRNYLRSFIDRKMAMRRDENLGFVSYSKRPEFKKFSERVDEIERNTPKPDGPGPTF